MAFVRGSFISFLLLLSLLVIPSISIGQAVIPSSPSAAIAQAKQLLASLTDGVPTARFAKVGREYGNIVDGVRKATATTAQLKQMRKITAGLRDRTIARLKAAESAAGENEGELEGLYRSIAWDDLSFALAAFPYWGAWIDLEISKRMKGADEKLKWIWEAKKGFRATSVQVFRPSLVYGGWLGLGYVAAAEGSTNRAVEIFESLQNSIADDPSHPLYDVVALELRLLRAKKGQVSGGPTGTGKVDAQEASLLRAEAFALFEQSRTTKSGARDAAQRLRRIINAGYVDDELVSLILQYRVEVVAHDIGPYTDLAGAEYAFENGHFFDAVRKYKDFFARVELRGNVNFDRIRYRQALAAYKAKLNDDAALIAESLLRSKKLDEETKKAAVKLAYVARATRKGKPTSASNRAMQRAAERFITGYPSDPDADGARLRVAQQTTDSNKAFYMLNSVKAPAKLRGGVQQTKFYIIARDFSNAIRRTKGKPPTGLASQGITAYGRLSNKERGNSENKVIAIQMRALVDKDPSAVIAAIDAAEQKGGLSFTARQGMMWARIKCLERLGSNDVILAYLQQVANAGLEGWQLEQIYPIIKANSDVNVRVAAANVLLPKLTSEPAMERRFKIVLIEGMLELQQYPQAYDQAKAFRDAYPKVGDAYRLFALAAAKTGHPIQADTSWKAITDRSDPRREIWWEGMLNRIEIRAGSTRPKSACEVLSQVDSQIELVPSSMAPKIKELRGNLPCAGQQTG
ncbi:MAG: hypothetical protein ACI915_000794 [Gammaproteobacteria bacterium]|jgi:hypothetical protein